MSDCLFCKIAAGEIPSDKVRESGELFAFRDIVPQAPTHILVVPKRHIASLADANDPALLGSMLSAIREIAREEGLEAAGYRVVTNIGEDGGQSVGHLHFHLLGGRALGWPPG
jgi:histidine triad (HIT) family protein